VDALLDYPAFFVPFAPHFDPLIGRPSTPVECCLRLMFLKIRYRLGYESLCAEVSDSNLVSDGMSGAADPRSAGANVVCGTGTTPSIMPSLGACASPRSGVRLSGFFWMLDRVQDYVGDDRLGYFVAEPVKISQGPHR